MARLTEMVLFQHSPVSLVAPSYKRDAVWLICPYEYYS